MLAEGDLGRTLTLEDSGQILVTLSPLIGAQTVEALDSDGSVDTSFGSGGQATFEFGDSSNDAYGVTEIQGLVVETNGAIIAAGAVSLGTQLMGVARFNPDGSLDTTFGSAGKLLTDVLVQQNLGGAPSMVVEPDGKLLVVPTEPEDGIWQYNVDGSVDTTFGDDGVAYPEGASPSSFSGVLLLPDGKILIYGADVSTGSAEPLLMCLLPDGSLDTSFGDAGFATVPLPATSVSAVIDSAAVMADGTIIVGTQSCISALNPDGTVDTSFGSDGTEALSAQGFNIGSTQVAVIAGGKIFATLSLTGAGYDGIAFARFEEDGTPDATFGEDGLVLHATLLTFGFTGQAIAPNGDIIVVTAPPQSAAVQGYSVTEFNPDGSVNTSFGSGGSTDTIVDDGGHAQEVAIAGDGSILVTGDATGAGGTGEFALVRYSSSGVLDSGFGEGGVVLTDIVPGGLDGESFDRIGAIALSPDSRTVYLAGEAFTTYIGVASYYNDPPATSPGTLQFQARSVSANQSAGTATIDVSRTDGSSGTVTVDYQTADGTAQAGINYTATSGTLTFGAGDCCASFIVPILGAGDAEDATVYLTLSDATGGATIGADDTAVLTILGSGGAGSSPGIIQLANSSVSASESDESAVAVVDRVGGSAGTVDVPYTVGGGTATPGVDYVPVSGTLTFGPGVTQLAVVVPLMHDAALAADTTFEITLGQPDGGATLAAAWDNASVTILDIDASSAVVPASGPTPVDANQGFAAVPVTRAGGLGNEVAYNYSTADGTAVGGQDYSPTSGTLVLSPGVSTGYIDIPITTNYQLTQPVAFDVVVSAPASASGPGSTTTLSVAIEPPAPLPTEPTPPPGSLSLVSTSPADGSTISSRRARSS